MWTFPALTVACALAVSLILWGLANLDARLAVEALDRQEAFVSYRSAHQVQP